MTDTALGAVPLARSDELESPARRALRRLFQRKGAVVGLVIIATFIAPRGLCTADCALRPDRHELSSGPQAARRRCIGSEPTISAATFSAA